MEQLILPSTTYTGNVTALTCAEKLYTKLAETDRFFYRGERVVRLDPNEKKLSIVNPQYFRSHIGNYFEICSYRSWGTNPTLRRGVCPLDTANLLLNSEKAEDILPKISIVTNSPTIVERNDKLVFLSAGYHSDCGKIYVLSDVKIKLDISLKDAVRNILYLIRECLPTTEGDRSRLVASFISPALRMGKLLGNADFPMEISEAQESQAGKTYRQKAVPLLYGETPYTITPFACEKNLDEMLGEALLSGKPFTYFDNWKGKLDSPLLESVIRGGGIVSVRVPYERAMEIRTDHLIFMLSSNAAHTSTDLRNRVIVNSIKKHAAGFSFHQYLEGDLHDHIRAKSGKYLGSIYTILKYWYDNGKPKTNETRHDFREWVQTLDWIVRNVFGLRPLLENHRESQIRISNPYLTWLREVCVAVRKNKQLNQPLKAEHIVAICAKQLVALPGYSSVTTRDNARLHVGKCMGIVFGDQTTTSVEDFVVGRKAETIKREEWKGDREVNYYTFTEKVVPKRA